MLPGRPADVPPDDRTADSVTIPVLAEAGLRQTRRARGLTLAAFARRAHVSTACASRWETGRRPPDKSQLPLIARALGLPTSAVADLLKGRVREGRTGRSGRGLPELREQVGLTRRDLAAVIGVAPTTVANWETGHRLVPASRLAPLAAALSQPVEILVVLMARDVRPRRSPLRQLRLRSGLSQASTAVLLGVSSGLVSSWERGVRAPSLHQARWLAVIYRVPLRDVVAASGILPPSDHLHRARWHGDDLGAIVLAIRLWSGQTRTDVARGVDVHPQTVTRWERNLTVPGAAHLRRLEAHLGLGEGELPSPPGRRRPAGNG